MNKTAGLLDDGGCESDNGILIHSIIVCRVADIGPFHRIAGDGLGLGLDDRPAVRSELDSGGQFGGRDVGEFDQRCGGLLGASDARQAAGEQSAPLARRRVWC